MSSAFLDDVGVDGPCYGAKVTKVTKLTTAIITSSGWSTAGVAIAYPQTVKLNFTRWLEEMTNEPL